jgi:hypothetical protein
MVSLRSWFSQLGLRAGNFGFYSIGRQLSVFSFQWSVVSGQRDGVLSWREVKPILSVAG